MSGLQVVCKKCAKVIEETRMRGPKEVVDATCTDCMSDDLKNAEFKITVVMNGEGLSFEGTSSLDSGMTVELFMTMLLAAAGTAGANSAGIPRTIELIDQVSGLLRQMHKDAMAMHVVDKVMANITRIAREACLSRMAEERMG